MSEYWKSTPKYYCKHCKAFVVDTPVSKKNHDATPKHQGALKRFLRDLHRNNEKEANASASAKREVARLNSLVSSASSSQSSSSSSSAQPSSSYRPAPPPRPLTEDERKRQLKELEALGVALPDEARRELTMVGEWTPAEVVEATPKSKDEDEKEKVKRELKRKYDEEEKERKWNAMDEDEREMRGFSIQTKTYPPKSTGIREGGFKPMVFKGKGKAKAEGPEVKTEDALVKTEPGAAVTEDKEPVIKPDPDAEATSTDIPIKKDALDAPEGITVKTEDAAVTKEDDGIVFKKRKVKNIRKKI